MSTTSAVFHIGGKTDCLKRLFMTNLYWSAAAERCKEPRSQTFSRIVPAVIIDQCCRTAKTSRDGRDTQQRQYLPDSFRIGSVPQQGDSYSDIDRVRFSAESVHMQRNSTIHHYRYSFFCLDGEETKTKRPFLPACRKPFENAGHLIGVCVHGFDHG